MPPQGSNLVLSSDIPHVEFGVLVSNGLDVEADCGNRGDVRVELQFVEDGCSCCQLRDPIPCGMCSLLVLPAASSPNIKRRISFDPKILFMSLEMFPPMFAVWPRHARGCDGAC